MDENNSLENSIPEENVSMTKKERADAAARDVAEVAARGAGRYFGGGALELMPSEVANLYIPYSDNNDKLFDKINDMLRKNINIEKILDYTDKIILKEQLNLSDEQIELAKNIRNKLVNKRLNRK